MIVHAVIHGNDPSNEGVTITFRQRKSDSTLTNEGVTITFDIEKVIVQ